MRGVHAAFGTNREISPSAEGDSRLCLENSRPFALRIANVLKGSIKAFVHFDSDKPLPVV